MAGFEVAENRENRPVTIQGSRSRSCARASAVGSQPDHRQAGQQRGKVAMKGRLASAFATTPKIHGPSPEHTTPCPHSSLDRSVRGHCRNLYRWKSPCYKQSCPCMYLTAEQSSHTRSPRSSQSIVAPRGESCCAARRLLPRRSAQ